MLHQINLLFRRFLTDARQLFRFFVIVNLIPCILLVFTEPYSFMGKVILVTFPLGMYLFVFSWLKNIGLMQLILIPQLIFNAFQIVLFYLFGESVIAVDMFLNLATTNVTEASDACVPEKDGLYRVDYRAGFVRFDLHGYEQEYGKL